MAGVRKKPSPGGKYYGWFTNAQGKQQFFTGTRSRVAPRRIAQHHTRDCPGQRRTRLREKRCRTIAGSWPPSIECAWKIVS